MTLLFLLLVGIQLLCSWASSPPLVEPPPLFLSRACNDSDVEAAADLALRQINANQREGYVLGLYRIFSVQEQPQKTTGSVFYLILDVIETECHVLSRKLWKDCKNRPEHKTVFGQCKASIYINKPRRIVHLHKYECILQPVPSSSVARICPDCPSHDNPTKPEYLETAVVSLAKLNKESEQAHHFSVLNVTRASMQWVVGPSRFVEFTIQETSCSEDKSIADFSKCKPLSPELAHTGFCKGSVVKSEIEHRDFVTISCEIYDPQAPATGDQEQHPSHKPEKPDHAESGSRDHHHHHHHDDGSRDHHHHDDGSHGHHHHHHADNGSRDHHHHHHHDDGSHGHHHHHHADNGSRDHHHHHHHDDGSRDHHHADDGSRDHHHRKGKQNRHKHSHRHNPKHEHHQQEHDHEHHPPSPSEASHVSLHLEKTVGWVKVLPVKEENISLHTLPESHVEPADGKPILTEKAKPGAALPHADGVTDVKKPPTDRPEGKPATAPAIPPFPEVPLNSDRCPGEPKFGSHILHSLLPTKLGKTGVSP